MGPTSPQRPDPEQLLRQIEAEEEFAHRGRLKIFLGYASGVGKSFRMLDEGRRRKERGQDVVIAAIQPHLDAQLARLSQQLEIIPLKVRDGQAFIDMDTVLARRPRVCLVDGLAYRNPPGSPRADRWQDVEVLLKAEVSVITTINVAYIAEHQEEVARITGKTVSHTVPVDFIRTADEVVVVDAPASVCTGQDASLQAPRDERRSRLTALREIALVLAADVVDRQLESYLTSHGVRQTWGAQERILVCLTPRAKGARLLESAKRVAAGFHGELIAAYVQQEALDEPSRQALEANLALARQYGAAVETLTGDDPIDAIVEFAQRRGITQIFVGHSMQEGWRTRLFGSPLDRLLSRQRGIDVRVFPH